METLLITPKTKIFDLLQAYPELEETLIGAAPEFVKLKNPVLRNTIARITNLGQAAVIGKIPVETLVNRLRTAAGQDHLETSDENLGRYRTEQPDWFEGAVLESTLDIRDMLNRGEQPVHEVMAALCTLQKGEVLEVIAPFVPAPLLDKSLSLGYGHWLNQRSDNEYRIYFTPQD